MERFISTLKKFLNKMGLNVKGKLLTGNEAKEKLAKDAAISNTGLTEKEIQFILTKLRQANYTGAEFELFYVIFSKLSNLLSKK